MEEIVRENSSYFDVAVIIGGDPESRDKWHQVRVAKERIAVKSTIVCMVHFAGDECCGVTRFPDWHAEFQHHMAKVVAAEVAGSAASSSSTPPPLPASSLLSLNLPGGHSAGYPIWFHWQVGCNPVFNQWWEMLWQMLVIRF